MTMILSHFHISYFKPSNNFLNHERKIQKRKERKITMYTKIQKKNKKVVKINIEWNSEGKKGRGKITCTYF